MRTLQKYRYWLMLVVSLSTCRDVVGDECAPCECNCFYFRREQDYPTPCVNCKSKELEFLPQFSLNITKTIKSLLLSYNKITTLEKNAFIEYTALKVLSLNDNHLLNVSRESFYGLKSLKELNLAGNQIHDLNSSIFQGLTSLEKLYLNGNDISTITEHSFNDLTSLRFLDLSSCKITSLRAHVFRQLTTLEVLYLRKNEITLISKNSFANLDHLRELELSENKIETLNDYAFEDLGKLEELHLDNNQIFEVSKGVLNNFFRLKFLSLYDNKIESLGNDTLSSLLSLEKLFLQRNRLRNIPRAFWIAREPDVTDVTLNIENNDFCDCSCKLVNELKQLEYKVKHLFYDNNDCDGSCPASSSVCEEERNFALGMKIGNEYEDLKNFISMRNAVDGDVSEFGTCKLERGKFYDFRIDLPGLIVVTNVTVIARYRHPYGTNVTIQVAVGDRLTDIYQPCDEFTLSHPYAKSSVNKPCATFPPGRDVKITPTINGKQGVMGNVWNFMHWLQFSSLDFYEVVVNGYEENKFNIWSEWNQWGACSEKCDNGQQIRNRTCNSPTSLKCILPNTEYQRSSIDYEDRACNLGSCFRAIYQWTIGGVVGVFILILLGVIFWYRKFKMITYFDGLRPNPNFEMDPDRTLLEQIVELPYDLHWEFPRYDVRFASVLGEGNFGRVWHAKAKGIKAFNPRDKSDLSSRAKLAKLQDQRVHDYFTTVTEAWVLGDCDSTHHYDVAVKTLKECATPQHEKDLASELKLLIYMDRHPNIVNILAACTIRGDLWVILEFCDHGCLKDFLSDRRNNFTPTWSKDAVDISREVCLFDLLQMSEQIANGVMFLHCWKVIHRDLSARNILVDSKFNMKIADFGLARSENFVASADDIMPIKWSSLESLLRHEYSTKSDIWSLGVLLWEIYSFGEMPYPGMSSREVVQQLKEGFRMSAPNRCPKDIWRIICDCWNADPEMRPSAMEVFEQLDEVKVSVVSAPNGVYYDTGCNDEVLGTVQGPSLDEILSRREGKECDGEEILTTTVVDVHNATIKDVINESIPNTITNKDRHLLEVELSEKTRELWNIERIVNCNSIKDDDRIKQIKQIINNEVAPKNDLTSSTQCNEINGASSDGGNLQFTKDVGHATVSKNVYNTDVIKERGDTRKDFELDIVQIEHIKVDHIDEKDEDHDSCV